MNRQKTIKDINDNLIQSYLTAIDNKSKEKIEILYNENNKNNIKKKKKILFSNCTSKINKILNDYNL